MIVENSRTLSSTNDKKQDLNQDLNITNLIERTKQIENEFSKK